MHSARIAELLQPFLQDSNDQRLVPNDLQNISTYIDILLRWNARINLTAIRNEEEIVTRHFGESLFVARHLFPNRNRETNPSRNSSAISSHSALKEFGDSVADLGSGAGFPGLPIKLWAPNIALTLIESNHKKATFLREVVRALALTEIEIMNVRAETITLTFDVVTFRAVEGFADALRVARPLLAPAGRLALLISSSQLPTAQSTLPDIIWRTPIPLPNSQSCQLLVGGSSLRTGAKARQTMLEP